MGVGVVGVNGEIGMGVGRFEMDLGFHFRRSQRVECAKNAEESVI